MPPKTKPLRVTLRVNIYIKRYKLMKLAIFDIGQTLVLNQDPYEVFVAKQIAKILPEIVPTIKRTPDLLSLLSQEAQASLEN